MDLFHPASFNLFAAYHIPTGHLVFHAPKGYWWLLLIHLALSLILELDGFCVPGPMNFWYSKS